MLTLPLRRFQPFESRTHSTGALYVALNNLPRHIRFLRENIFLLCVLPGPHEPSQEQINSILDLMTDELKVLGKGQPKSVLSLPSY